LRAGIVSARAILDDGRKSYKARCEAVAAKMDQLLEGSSDTDSSVIREGLVSEPVRVNTILTTYAALDIEGDPTSKDARLWDALKALRDAGAKQLPEDFDMSLIDAKWKPLVGDGDRIRGFAAAQACAAIRIRQALRAG